MKILLTFLVLITFTTACNNHAPDQSQRTLDSAAKPKPTFVRNPKRIIETIFNDYTKNEESVESEDNLDSMRVSIEALKHQPDSTALPLLIDVWMYYDPTDFPTRDLIEPLFQRDSLRTLKAIETRLKNKKKWEDEQSAPYSDLIYLREQFIGLNQ